MRMPKYPAGVPSPYSTHVHPYPTRFHGPIYTRPVFGFPYQQGVQSVFKPDDFSEFYEGKKDMGNGGGGNGSLGELQYNTGRGIFRPGGRGGGIFDGNIAGLGGTGLGATCADQAQSDANDFCNANVASLAVLGYSSISDCVQKYAADLAKSCAPSASSSGGGSYPWGVYSADTLALQKYTNASLKQYGYCPITEDGKLGKGTCGARRALQSVIPGMTNPSTCQAFTTPSKAPCGGGGGSVAPAASKLTPQQQAALVQTYGSGSDWKKYAVFGVGAVAVLGLAYYFEKRRSKK